VAIVKFKENPSETMFFLIFFRNMPRQNTFQALRWVFFIFFLPRQRLRVRGTLGGSGGGGGGGPIVTATNAARKMRFSSSVGSGGGEGFIRQKRRAFGPSSQSSHRRIDLFGRLKR